MKPSAIIIDTSALLCALVWNYVRLFPADPAKRQRLVQSTIPGRYRSIARFDEQFLLMLEKYRSVDTASYVIAELQGLTKGRAKLNGAEYGDFWTVSIDYLTKRVEEHTMRLADLCGDVNLRRAVIEIGPTDTALIELARRHRLPILSLDGRTLALRAKEFDTACYFPEDLLYGP